MTRYDFFGLLGGLALFLYGMQMMSRVLQETAGQKAKQLLGRLTKGRLKGILAGTLVTALIQSSSAVTVMVVGFVNADMMTLNQAVWVIMGANIGTTITGQLVALNISAFAPFLTMGGVILLMAGRGERTGCAGSCIAGLGIMLMGMNMMSGAMVPLQSVPGIVKLLTDFQEPVFGIWAGAVFSAVIQSSSAAIGIMQAMGTTGVMTLKSAVYVLFGQNIGTCITALLASIGTRKSAQQAAAIHLVFNVAGAAVFTVLCMAMPLTAWIEALTPEDVSAQIANMSTFFNIGTTLLFLPFGDILVRLSVWLLPDRKDGRRQLGRVRFF